MEKKTALQVLTQICEASSKAGILNLADAVNAVNALQTFRNLIDDDLEKDKIIEEFKAK